MVITDRNGETTVQKRPTSLRRHALYPTVLHMARLLLLVWKGNERLVSRSRLQTRQEWLLGLGCKTERDRGKQDAVGCVGACGPRLLRGISGIGYLQHSG